MRKKIVVIDVFCGAMVTASTRGTMYTTDCFFRQYWTIGCAIPPETAIDDGEIHKD